MEPSKERQDLVEEQEYLEKRLAKVQEVLKAMDLVEEYLSKRDVPSQSELPIAGRFSDIGMTKMLREILWSDTQRWWTLDSLMETARAGGANLDRYVNARNSIGVASDKMVKRGEILKRKHRGQVQFRAVKED